MDEGFLNGGKGFAVGQMERRWREKVWRRGRTGTGYGGEEGLELSRGECQRCNKEQDVNKQSTQGAKMKAAKVPGAHSQACWLQGFP